MNLCIIMLVLHTNYTKGGDGLKFLSTIRKKNGLTQADLADKVGVSLNSIARYERGEVIPSANIAHLIANVLGCTESELLNGPEDDKIKITLVYDWSEMKKGEIRMNENKFKLILGEDGMVGLNGAGKITSREAIEEFLSRVRNELEIALEAQMKRGVIPEA